MRVLHLMRALCRLVSVARRVLGSSPSVSGTGSRSSGRQEVGDGRPAEDSLTTPGLGSLPAAHKRTRLRRLGGTVVAAPPDAGRLVGSWQPESKTMRTGEPGPSAAAKG